MSLIVADLPTRIPVERARVLTLGGHLDANGSRSEASGLVGLVGLMMLRCNSVPKNRLWFLIGCLTLIGAPLVQRADRVARHVSS